jgi:hypothetical protein
MKLPIMSDLLRITDQTASIFCPCMKNASKPSRVLQGALIHNHAFVLFNLSREALRRSYFLSSHAHTPRLASARPSVGTNPQRYKNGHLKALTFWQFCTLNTGGLADYIRETAGDSSTDGKTLSLAW